MILADENVHYSLVKELRRLKVDVLPVVDTDFRGVADEELIEIADRNGRVLLTRDSDFVRMALKKRIGTGVIYVAVPITKENYRRLAVLIKNNLKKCVGKLMIVHEDYAEIINI
ncbi:MAG: hypothetical protein DRJ55_02650 [Thermoprotei archaeon]|nr:MAG: hypothetical protein DRJ55_02650 [Thermoprotei archaeon]